MGVSYRSLPKDLEHEFTVALGASPELVQWAGARSPVAAWTMNRSRLQRWEWRASRCKQLTLTKPGQAEVYSPFRKVSCRIKLLSLYKAHGDLATGISLTLAWLVCPCSDSSSPSILAMALAQSAHFCLRLDPADSSPGYTWGSFPPILPSVGPNVTFSMSLSWLSHEPSPRPLQHSPPASPASALSWHPVICSVLYSDYHPSEA